MPTLQEMVYRFENLRTGRGWLLGLGLLIAVLLVVGYNALQFHNLKNPEAMDAAQLARNLAEGRGYTTQFIRPFSIHLLQTKNAARRGDVPAEVAADPARLKGPHPDLANPPVYPVVLAGLMKVLPFRYSINVPGALGADSGQPPAPTRPFTRYQPDFLIALFNQALLLASVFVTFFLARRLFDAPVAWLTAILVFTCDQLWRFSMSGLSTQLLLLIFLGLIWCLVWLEREEREPAWGPYAQFGLAAAVGLLLGLGTLTRYSFGWLLIPVLIYMAAILAVRRVQLLLITLGLFLVAVSPWVARNVAVSGTPFGTATYAVYEGTFFFPENKLERSLQPSFLKLGLRPFTYKLAANSREILQNDLPKLGGSWVSALFLAGLLLGYRSPALRRLRYFLIGTLLTLLVVQSLGRTQLSADLPLINSENLLVLTVPLVFLFGAGLFFQLLDQITFETRELRSAAIGLFALVACLPILYNFLPPKTSPVAYPPYYPPVIQQSCGWMKENELMMSDIPWAVAWYGDRQCVWLTLDAKADFYAINDYIRPVRALYLTPETTDSRFLSQWVQAGADSWGGFILDRIVRDSVTRLFADRPRIADSFPLRASAPGFFPSQLFLTDSERWKGSPPDRVAPATEKEAGAPDKAATTNTDAAKP